MQAISSYPLHTHIEHDENEILGKKEVKHMYNETIQPPETNGTIFLLGPSLLGAEFVRGRVCQGPSLSGAEMSWNHFMQHMLVSYSSCYFSSIG